MIDVDVHFAVLPSESYKPTIKDVTDITTLPTLFLNLSQTLLKDPWSPVWNTRIFNDWNDDITVRASHLQTVSCTQTITNFVWYWHCPYFILFVRWKNSTLINKVYWLAAFFVYKSIVLSVSLLCWCLCNEFPKWRKKSNRICSHCTANKCQNWNDLYIGQRRIY